MSVSKCVKDGCQLKVLEAEVARLTDELIDHAKIIADLQAERNELRAQEPVAYLKFWAAQMYAGHGNIETEEGFEVCKQGEVGIDGSPAFPVFARPVPATQAVPDADEWKSIDTAPEGVHILLWFPKGEKGIGGMECGTIYRGDPVSPGGIAIWTHGGPNSGSDWQLDEAPTLWKPLQPPATQNDEAILFAAEAKLAAERKT